jgi:hypothetical protein
MRVIVWTVLSTTMREREREKERVDARVWNVKCVCAVKSRHARGRAVPTQKHCNIDRNNGTEQQTICTVHYCRINTASLTNQRLLLHLVRQQRHLDSGGAKCADL